MLDISLGVGSQETGIVNFKLLHTFLECMIVHMNLQKTQIEYTGPQSEIINSMLLKLNSDILITERDVVNGTPKWFVIKETGDLINENKSTGGSIKRDLSRESEVLSRSLEITEERIKKTQEIVQELQIKVAISEEEIKGRTREIHEMAIQTQDIVKAINDLTVSSSPHSMNLHTKSVTIDVPDVPTRTQTLSQSKISNFNMKLKVQLVDLESEVCKIQKEFYNILNKFTELIEITTNNTLNIQNNTTLLNQLLVKLDDLTKGKVQTLWCERSNRQRQIDSIIEAIEHLKCYKSDRQELDELNQQKADHILVNTKVDYHILDTIKHDLSSLIIKSLETTNAQDKANKIISDNLLTLIESKIDKRTLVPVQKHIMNQIRSLETKIDELTAKRMYQESAVTHLKQVNNLVCLACGDGNVIMNHRERNNTIPKINTAVKRPYTVPFLGTKSEDHEINRRPRVCGGQHTRVKPLERVPRQTDFFLNNRVKPPISDADNLIRGSDGVFYKGSKICCCQG